MRSVDEQYNRPSVSHYNPKAKLLVEGAYVPCIFFYGGTFSNFVGDPITVTSNQPWAGDSPVTAGYATVEHFFQASKAHIESDHWTIAWANSAGESKSFGNMRQSFADANQPLLRQDWEAVKYDYMLLGVRAKFRQDEQFKRELLETGDIMIAEDSPTDFIWGIRDERGGFTGQNLLGKALMEVRKELRDAST